ncbi:TetR family transcriptional regulator [Ktedonobacteria bacterium brp13]|nr:TetR family transcriptional regulator [Ktedonobacteria bacterium brp13]
MKQEKHDRRSLRTRHLVHSALMELLLEKRYEAITVRDILNRAGIGSSTFYAHYFDKEDVRTDVIEHMLEQLLPSMVQKTVEQGVLPSLEIFRQIQEHSQHRHFQALMRGHAEERIWEVLQTRLSTIIEQTLASANAKKNAPSVPLEVVASYLSGAFLHLLKWWIKAEIPYSPERMDEIFQQLALPGVWTILERKGVHDSRA